MLGLLGVSGAVLATAGATAGVSGAGAARAEPAGTADGLRAFDQFVREQADSGAFSGSLLLIHRGRPVLARSYGRANDSALNGPDTLFAMASVTKLFTAVAVAQLAQAGKLAYGDKLGAHVSGFPAEIADKVSIHHLLTHTSGLGDPFTWPGFPEESATWTTPEQVMAGWTGYIRRSSLAFPPGAGFQYSNAGYHMLGEIVAAVSGQSYYDYVREHVFRAAGMSSTGFYTTPQWKTDPRMAHPYAKGASGEFVDAIDRRGFIGTPAGDAFSTCADMGRFARALQGETLLNRAFTGITLTGKTPLPPPPGPGPAVPPVGFQCYGPMTQLVNNQWATGHAGGAPGTATEFQMYPDSQWVSVILCNRDYALGVPPPVMAKARELITA